MQAKEHEAVGGTVQLGSGHDISIGELAEPASRALDRPARVLSTDERLRPQHSEVAQLLSDPTLVKELLGWTPKICLEDGIARTAEWMSKTESGEMVERYLV